ncbi:DrmB family protein [Tenacibaculum discolor]|uniref:DrmB family protein n=1 Tax=Tenacibaculum discolor TaxID=361581 RepID=UPI003F793E58
MPNDKIKHGRSKHISNYGGVGSLIETTDNSIMIETFDNWGYVDLNEKLAHYIIKDDRLLQRLKNRFPNLKHLVSIPTDRDSSLHQVRPKANYFSKWFYCSYCKRFAPYNEWKTRWRSAGKKLDFFNPPKCSNKDCKENHLEQIRFVMTCKNGHIHDLPWKFWNNRLPSDRTNEQEKEEVNEKLTGPQLDFSKPCCENQNLIYKISRENTELSGIWIECKNCNKKANLKGIFNYEQICNGKKYWLGQINGKFYEEDCYEITNVKLKTSNSVYYSNSLSSLFIPELQNPLSPEVRIDIDNMLESGEFSTEQIVQLISIQKKIEKELIQQYLDTGDIKYIPDNIYRQTEYDYFLEKKQPDNKQIKFHVIDSSEQINGFVKLIKIDKLKKTTVQTSFTRNEPIDIDSILLKDGDNAYEYTVKRQSVSKNNFDTKTLPASESYGEGILFILDKQKLEQWESQQEVIERTEKIKTNANNADWKSHQIIAKTLTPRKVLIHTLSHLLMRELEYVCGYPVSSLSERLYVNETMYGFLISAFDGTDGYLGGLSNLCNDLDNLNNIVNSAIFRATDCSSDPICIESDGQGVGQLNLAACHSCALTPETTCELSNLYLDRGLVINKEYGYFADR